MKRHSRFIALSMGLLCLFTSSAYSSGMKNPIRQSLDSVVSRGDNTWRAIRVGSISIDSDTISIDSSGTDMIFSDGSNNSVTLTTLASGGAPTTATYITQTANGSLSAEQALTSVTSGLLSNDSATGVISSRTISGTASEVDVSSTSSAITIGIVDPLAVGKGGIGVATLTDGGVLIGKGTAAVTDTGLLGKGTLIVGDGVTNPTTLTVGSDGFILSADSSTASGLSYTAPSPLTATGDIYTRNATGNTRLGVGTNGQIMSVDSANANGIKWAEPTPLTTKGDLFTYKTSPSRIAVGADGTILSADSSTVSGLNYATRNSILPVTVKGSIMTYSTKPIELLVGTNGQVLSADSANGNGVKWAEATPLTTKGDIFVYNSSPTRLSVGTNGQVLSADSSVAKGVKWAEPTPLTTKGDVMVYAAAPSRIGVGTNGFVLSADSSTASGLSWVKPSPLTTKGDIFVYGASPTRLPIGTNGKILSADSSTATGLVWVTAPQSGATSPAGGTGSIQYNNGGSFGGAAQISTDSAGTRLSIGPKTSTVSLDVGGSFRTVPITLTDAATINVDASQSNTFFVTLGGNRTLGKPTNGFFGQKITFIISQDATGTRKLGFASGINFGTTVTTYDSSTTVGYKDMIGMIYNNASWDVVAVAQGFP